MSAYSTYDKKFIDEESEWRLDPTSLASFHRFSYILKFSEFVNDPDIS